MSSHLLRSSAQVPRRLLRRQVPRSASLPAFITGASPRLSSTTTEKPLDSNFTSAPTNPPDKGPKTEGTTDKAAATEIGDKHVVELYNQEVLAAAYEVSGAPEQLLHRPVRIYQPTRNTMQSGGAKGEKWRIDWDTLPGGGRWENPLMGWASSADYMQGTRMSFNTMEDAVRFAEKQGWSYYVQPGTVKRIPPKNYAENYVYKPNKLRIARTK